MVELMAAKLALNLVEMKADQWVSYWVELLVDKSDALRFQADNFVKTGRALKRKMWCDNMKMKVIFAIIALALLLSLIFGLCGKKCR